MISIVQRVREASVGVDERTVSAIGPGLLALVAVCESDADADVQWTARKLVELRIFRNAEKHFDLDIKAAGGSILLVSNFTVAAATRQGRRPSFDDAAGAEKGRRLFGQLVDGVRQLGVPVQTGAFGADMQVHLINDGPATFLLDSAGVC